MERKFDSDVKGTGRGYLEIVKASNHQGKVFKSICLLCSQAEGTVPKKKKKKTQKAGDVHEIGMCIYEDILFKVLIVMAFVQSLNEVLFH